MVEDWTVFKCYREWHGDAMFSSGFNTGSGTEDGHHYLPVVEEQIHKEMPYYEALYKHRTIG